MSGSPIAWRVVSTYDLAAATHPSAPMARQPRIALAHQPHLVIQSTRAESIAFVDDEDRRLYLGALLESSRSSGVAIHAYALADRRVEMLATPGTAEALGQWMQRLGRRYVAAFNRRHGRSGPLWAGRFGAAALDAERHLLAGVMLVEQMPVRDGCIGGASDWPWSSAAHHIGSRRDPLVVEHALYWRLGNTPFEREARHARLLETEVPGEAVMEMEAATKAGKPLITDAVGAKAGTTRPRGRPRSMSGNQPVPK